QAEDGIRDFHVTGVQTCALPISTPRLRECSVTIISKATATPEVIEADSLRGIAGVCHGFFGRRGGVSGGPFASLNCGFGAADNQIGRASCRERGQIPAADGWHER